MFTKASFIHQVSHFFYRLIITLLVVSFFLSFFVLATSCSDKDYGFTKDELYQAAQESRYDKEFQKLFPDVDPRHTWMCEPDTFYYPVQTATRAISVPVINTSVTEWMTMPYAKVSAALDYMKEEADNRGKCAQDFEYIALQETTYDIYPTFWGRKFCDANKIGIYYIDGNGKRVDMDPFWQDATDRNNIYAIYEDGTRAKLENSEQPITDYPREAWNESIRLYHNCPICSGTGKIKQNRKQVTCTTCQGKGKYEVVKYEFPKYTLTVPEGMKWGIYLETKKTQASTASDIRWYSNANYNDDKISAAATFTYDGVTYCSFEDAPHNLHGGSGTGTCTCGYGHYDRDFNDIVLTITPRPIESTYRAIKYRVMCEDLGGTFDWDFNDVVYDIVYEEGKNADTNATLSVVIQAIGGTLPVRMYFNGNPVASNDQELHEAVGKQSPDQDDLYLPINVVCDKYETQKGTAPMAFLIHQFSTQTVKDIDIRDYAKDILIRVDQKNGTTTQVVFPQDFSGAVPQCFMTSVGTEWADELQKITIKYPQFASWVSHFSPSQEWWLTDPNF